MLRCRPGPGITPGGRPGRRNVASVTHHGGSAAIRVVRDIAEHDLRGHCPGIHRHPRSRGARRSPRAVCPRSSAGRQQVHANPPAGNERRPPRNWQASGDASAWQPTAPVIRSARTINATRSRTVQVLHPRYHVGRPLRGEYLASSVSRQAPLLAPATALACSHLSRASSPGLRSARLYQRRPAVARATAPIARPANPSALPTPISTAATASSSRGRSCRDGSVRRDGVTMTCSHDSLSSDTAPDTPPTHASVESMTGHPPGRVTVASACRSSWQARSAAAPGGRRSIRRGHTGQPGHGAMP